MPGNYRDAQIPMHRDQAWGKTEETPLGHCYSMEFHRMRFFRYLIPQ